jgi:hypothetical protein
MNVTRPAAAVALILLAGCMAPEATSQLDADIGQAKSRIEKARTEQQRHAKGTVMHDLAGLTIRIEEQTAAMLEQRRVAARWKTELSYTVDGQEYVPESLASIKSLEHRLRAAKANRAEALEQIATADEITRPLIEMSAGTTAILISQLEYRLAASRYGFPAYYVPFQPPAEATAPPQMITVPENGTAVLQ